MRAIFRASETWVSFIGLMLPVLPIEQHLRDSVVIPIWSYVSFRLLSKGAKAIIPARN